MKRFLSIILALLSAFVLASCKGTNDKDAQNTAPPHSAASETAAPTETPTAAPETEAPMADRYKVAGRTFPSAARSFS